MNQPAIISRIKLNIIKRAQAKFSKRKLIELNNYDFPINEKQLQSMCKGLHLEVNLHF